MRQWSETPERTAGNLREAAANFTLSNSVFRSDNLEIKSTGFRIQYRGTVDFQQRVNARVEAEPLRDVWLVGRLLSLGLSPITKLFEFKVTGTLAEPKSEPIYVPKFIQWMLHPMRTIQGVIEAKPVPPPVPEPPAVPPVKSD